MLRRLFALFTRRPVIVHVNLDARDFDAKAVARAVRAELFREQRRNGARI